MDTTAGKVKVRQNWESIAWKWMRYSGLLLIPLAWIHVAIQDVIIGVHRINLDYVALRWSMLGWRVYDFFLLSFAFAHGVNGLRQVLRDFIRSEAWMRNLSWMLIALWVVFSLIGIAAIVGGVRMPAP